jgi:hypothetical protein
MIWNVIDSRSNRHRWAKIHAIVEATWHDNSASGADQAPKNAAETDVVFDQRKDISLNDAINWANSQRCPVTLYISDGGEVQHSPSEEVNAAARILDGYGRHRGWWSSATPAFDDLDPIKKRDFRFIVEGMLRAAAKVRSESPA